MADAQTFDRPSAVAERQKRANMRRNVFYLALVVIGLVAPFVAYPVFLMKILCFALFACAFNLLPG